MMVYARGWIFRAPAMLLALVPAVGAWGTFASGVSAAERPDPKSPAADKADGEPAGSGPDKGADDSFDGRVAAAWQALAQRDVERAKTEIAAAAKRATAAQQKAEVGQLQLLALCIERFWQAVDAELKRLQPSDELDLGGARVAVVETGPRGLTLHLGGKNQRYSRLAMPGPWALAVAEHRFDNSPPNKLLLGAFLAVDPQGDRSQARKIWEKTQRDEPNAGELLKLLASANIPAAASIPARRGKGAAEEKSNDDAPDEKEMAKGKRKKAAPDDPPPPAEPAEAPSKEKLITGSRKVKETYAAEIRAAKSPESKLELSETLFHAGTVNDDDTMRLALMRQALDLAAGAGSASAIDEIVDKTGRWFKIDAWEMSADAITRAAAGAKPESVGEIVRRAVVLLADWEDDEKAANKAHAKLAQKLEQAALSAAHRVRDPELVDAVIAAKSRNQKTDDRLCAPPEKPQRGSPLPRTTTTVVDILR